MGRHNICSCEEIFFTGRIFDLDGMRDRDGLGDGDWEMGENLGDVREYRSRWDGLEEMHLNCRKNVDADAVQTEDVVYAFLGIRRGM